MSKRMGDPYAAYRETKHSRRGALALILGLIALLILLGTVLWSMSARGEALPVAGALGLSAFALCFAGLVTGLKSFSDRCRSYLLSKIGTVLCGLMVAAWFLVICVGLAG